MRKYGNNPLTDKDMSVLREGDDTRTQRDQKVGNVKDYSMRHRIALYWDLNDEAKRDLMVKMVIDDDIEVIFDAEDMMRYLRWV